ncbi:hypothetical protein [Candidatus Chloroploca asiatica]|uniref:Uncharacterized protein n=1 Tax=Candidatus Chloroploca asiatica TaxID=1506545 RepID=A0A2H3KZR9_9CHLR|nr:hypothetical protein [Candidatus Chloroploca asiatica]PDW01273.1 hypothetical protein A9Q02_07520 [Candidatus Chloroploca asiatica]
MSTRPYLGINVNAASADELRYRGLLEEGEILLALFDGVLLDERRRRVGGLALSDFVALTERRVITWARGFFNDTVDSFEWKDVDVVEAETWDPWHGRVTLAFRLPPVAPRKRRIAVNGSVEDPGSGERLVINTLDYMPTDDVTIFARMVELIGDQIIVGVAGEELVAAFVEAFPVVEHEPLQPFFTAPEPAPPPVAEPLPEATQTRKRWWQVGSAGEEQRELVPPTTPGNLIAAYESQRGGAPAGSGVSPLASTGPIGPLPNLPEQPSMYEVSRSLRLVLEAPRKLARGLRRATEAVGGANEMVSGLQDPRVRRNAMRGLYYAASQQESEGGPFAPVAPVVRAAVRFAEPLEDEQADQQQSKRIQVRAAVRRAPPSTQQVAPEAKMPPPQTVAQPRTAPMEADRLDPQRPEPVKRSISVRRIETAPQPVAYDESAQAEPVQPAADHSPTLDPNRAAPVRRIAVGRPERVLHAQETVEAAGPRVISYNGNGVHHDEDE